MNRQWSLYLLIAWVFILTGCGAPATPVPSTPTPGVGVPVRAGDWEVTLNNIRQPDNWSGTKPKSGYAFLVLDATFHNLNTSRETRVVNDAIAIIESDGQIRQPAGWNLPDHSNVDMVEVGDLKKDPIALGVKGGFGFVPTFGSQGDTLTATYLFIFSADSLTKPLKFQFQDIEIPIVLNK